MRLSKSSQAMNWGEAAARLDVTLLRHCRNVAQSGADANS
jgi:hypothetical protein